MKEAFRTMIAIISPASEKYDSDGFLIGGGANLFGEGNYIPCEWTDAGGSNFNGATRHIGKKRATLKMRYHPDVNEACKVYLAGDAKPFDITSVENVGNRNYQLIIKVERVVRTV